MATLQEIRDAMGDGDMINLVEGAIAVKAASILGEVTPGAERLAFAEQALATPSRYSSQLWIFMLGNNSSSNLDAILRSSGDPATPTDVTIQGEVNTAVDALYPQGA